MKILYVIQRFLPASLTGSEKVIATVSTAMSELTEHDVTVVTSDMAMVKGIYDPYAVRYPKEEKLDRLKVIRLQINWFLGSALYVIGKTFPKIDQLLGGRLSFLAFGPYLMNLESAIKKERPKLIHTGPMPLHHVYDTWKIARKHNIPLVITPMMHFDHPMFENPLIYKILKQTDKVITFTEFEKRELEKRGIDGSIISVIPATYIAEDDFNLGDGNRFRKAHKIGDDPVILFLGTKAHEKGAVHLLEVLPEVQKSVPEAKLIFAGLPTASWQQEYERRDLSGVINLDYIAGSDKHDLLAAANVLAVPSLTESFGIVVPEAWAKGKPVIVGPTGASRELIDEGVDGFSIGFGDTEKLAKCLIDLLGDPAKQKTMGEAGRKKARTLSKKLLVDKTNKVYKSLTG